LGDGRIAIYDYKSGKPPTEKEERSFSKQLWLEAAMAADGAFGNDGPLRPRASPISAWDPPRVSSRMTPRAIRSSAEIRVPPAAGALPRCDIGLSVPPRGQDTRWPGITTSSPATASGTRPSPPCRARSGRRTNDRSDERRHAAQVTAAAPDVSTWLSANAGSGKTRVLTDRVARLLLDEVPPERILCLTYTKAAAMEMQNRLFSRLGDWAMTPEVELAQALAGGRRTPARVDSDLLSRARTLFARAIETPGGLKIQTIHSFCASVLRRFPLEAGVSPGFTEIDERVQGRLIADLLDEIAEDPARQYAIDAVVPYLGDEDGITQLSRAVAGRAEAFAPPLDWGGVAQVMGIDPGLDDDGLLEKVFVGVERALCERLLPALNPKYSLHAAACRVLPGFPWDAASLDALAEIEAAFLYGPDSKKAPNEPRKEVIENKNVVSVMGGDLAALREFAFRLRDARPLRLGLLNARKTHALHRFAEVFLPAYHAAKTARGWLDFDDLIVRTKELLTSPDIAQWVLFRLDGGIDHILVDEAQDTSPAQWDIVKRLAEDFAAGQGARAEVQRTIFVVGDKKQSIYSFQGADPEGFDRMRVHFGDRLRGVGQRFRKRDLLYSFRSARPILQLVDEVCGPDRATGVGGDLEHKAFHAEPPRAGGPLAAGPGGGQG
jgi:ATP-dependent helicase/nuclease subunit A